MQMFDHQAAKQDRWANQIISFEVNAVRQKDGTYQNVEFINIFVDRLNNIVKPVTEDLLRDPYIKERYDAFKAGEHIPLDGIPIKEWAAVTPADVSSCKAAKIYTIEQLADAPDEHLQRNHLTGLKYKAIDWLRSNKNAGVLGELREELEAAKKKIQALEDKNSDLLKEIRKPKRRGKSSDAD